MKSAITFEVEGMQEVRGMLSWYSDRELHNRLRRGVRAGAKPFQGTLRAAAVAEPTGNVPQSFRKVRAPKVSASRRRGGEIVASVKPRSPLFNIFEPGASAHTISGSPMIGPAGGAEWSDKGRKRPSRFFAQGSVHHPGMRARPIIPTAFQSGKAAGLEAATAVIFEPSR